MHGAIYQQTYVRTNARQTSKLSWHAVEHGEEDDGHAAAGGSFRKSGNVFMPPPSARGQQMVRSQIKRNKLEA